MPDAELLAVPVRRGDGGEGRHTRGSALYRGDCIPCLEDGKRVAYIGESGFSGSHRLSGPTGHRSDILRGNTKNAMAKHAATVQGGPGPGPRDPSLFKVKVLGNFPSALYRQVAEGAEIAYATDIDQLMNSREEWRSPSLQRISVSTEIRQPGRN